MSLITQMREIADERKKVLDQAGLILSKAHDEKRDLTAEETGEFEMRHDAAKGLLAKIEMLQKQLDALAIDGPTPTRGEHNPARGDIAPANPLNHKLTPEQRAKIEERAFLAFCRGGRQSLNDEMRAIVDENATVVPDELRALTVTTTGGGHLIPQGFMNQLEENMLAFGGILSAATILRTSTGNQMPYPTANDTGNKGSLLGINTAADVDADPSFGVINFESYVFNSKIVLVPIQLMQDSAFDMAGYLSRNLAERIERRTAEFFTTGTGTGEPQGIVTAAAFGVTAASATAVTYNELLDLQHSVDSSYRRNGAWMFNDQTFKLIRKMVDSDGRPLFQANVSNDGIRNGPPDTLLGDRFFINHAMANPGDGNKTILYGDLAKYHVRLVQGGGLVRFDEKYMNALQVGFLAYIRADGRLLDAGTKPIRFLTHVTS